MLTNERRGRFGVRTATQVSCLASFPRLQLRHDVRTCDNNSHTHTGLKRTANISALITSPSSSLTHCFRAPEFPKAKDSLPLRPNPCLLLGTPASCFCLPSTSATNSRRARALSPSPTPASLAKGLLLSVASPPIIPGCCGFPLPVPHLLR